MKPVRIVVFAKAPVAGLAKTRLIPMLGPEGAALLARNLLVSTLCEALRTDVGPVELCVTPDADDAAWIGVRVPGCVAISSQGTGDLGTRLARASERVLASGEAVLLIGTDCPALTSDRLREAASGLEDSDAVLYPAADGGYVLLGLDRHDDRLFEDIPWSTKAVSGLTVRRIHELGWSMTQGPTLNDIDVPTDLAYLPEDWRQHLRLGGATVRP